MRLPKLAALSAPLLALSLLACEDDFEPAQEAERIQLEQEIDTRAHDNPLDPGPDGVGETPPSKEGVIGVDSE